MVVASTKAFTDADIGEFDEDEDEENNLLTDLKRMNANINRCSLF